MVENFYENLQDLIEKLNIVEKMYDEIRLVDPVKKKVMNFNDNFIEEKDEKCYSCWEEEKICDNCISMRAYKENNSFVKMEYSFNKVFMINAIPVIIDNKRYIIEMIKDVTNSMFIGMENEEKMIEVSSLIKNTNLIAIKDGLTNVFNRRYLDERLPSDIVKNYINNQPLSIIFTDIDFFKKVNDNYGHQAGDQILKDFSSELLSNIRSEGDWVARYGGEEFIICLSNTSLETAERISERIREKTEKSIFKYNNIEISITASFGISSTSELKNPSMEELIEIADKKLYFSKNNGRNKVTAKI